MLLAEMIFVVVLCFAVGMTLAGIYQTRWTIAAIAFTVALVCLVSLAILMSGSA